MGFRKWRWPQFGVARRAKPGAPATPRQAVSAATIAGMKDLAIDDLQLFARVAALGNLSAVARERDAPASQVSRALAHIEKICGARLIHRSTHGLSLTPEGGTLLDYCQRISGTLEELEGEFATQAREASGLVRVAASTVVAQYQLLPSLAGLHEKHPKLRVELQVSDQLVDLASDGIDIAIRSATHFPGTVVVRQIGALGRALYASPSARHRLPKIKACLDYWAQWFDASARASANGFKA